MKEMRFVLRTAVSAVVVASVLSGCATTNTKPSSGASSQASNDGVYVEASSLPQVDRRTVGLPDVPSYSYYQVTTGGRGYGAFNVTYPLVDFKIKGKPFYGNTDPRDLRERVFVKGLVEKNGKYYLFSEQAGGTCQGKKLPLYDEIKWERFKSNAQRYDSRIIDPHNWTYANNPWKLSSLVYEVDKNGKALREVKCWPGEYYTTSYVSEGGDFFWRLDLTDTIKKVPAEPGSQFDYKVMYAQKYDVKKIEIDDKGNAHEKTVISGVNGAVPAAPGKWYVVMNAKWDMHHTGPRFLRPFYGTLYELDEKTGQLKKLADSVRAGGYMPNAVIQPGYHVGRVTHNTAWEAGVISMNSGQNKYYNGFYYMDAKTGKKLFETLIQRPNSDFFGEGEKTFAFRGKDGHRYGVTWEEKFGASDIGRMFTVGMLNSKALEQDFLNGHLVVVDLDNPKRKWMTDIIRPVGSKIEHIISATGEHIVFPRKNIGFGDYGRKGWVITDPAHMKILPEKEIWDWYHTVLDVK